MGQPVVIAIAVNLPGADSFDFYAPAALPTGRLALLPWGKGRRIGVVLQSGVAPSIETERIKPVLGTVATWPVLPAPVMELARFTAAYYQRGVGEVLLPAIPEPLTRAAAYAADAGVAQFTKLKRAKRFTATAGSDSVAAPALNSEQAAAVAHINATTGYAAHLLFGVTGSGKTEVYLHAAATALARGKTVLMLVPEIALTENLSAQVMARFPDIPVARMTSALSDGERALGWLDALQGRARIVIGTRSAIFAPLANVGLIIVDEEHDASYKQSEGARWHGRDLAVMRARLENCPVVLGSATPSLETWANVQTGRYTLLRLAQRANTAARLPRIEMVEPARAAATETGLSQRLHDALTQRLQAGEQSLVFLNRRGYAPVLMCEACDWVADCDNCSAHFALHRARGKNAYRLICHHCSAHRPVPLRCPQCGNADLLPKGRGTQKLEDTLAQALPTARIARMDADTTRRRGAGAQLLQNMDEGSTDILVGTQMTAKGHDFARLTLVGVLGADQSLTSPDFRAEERLFALLMQVAGRAGRADKPGEVLIETKHPRHALFEALQQQDYEAVATRLLTERQELGLPPYVSFALLRASAKSDSAAQRFLQDARALAQSQDGIHLYHPVPQAVPRVANQSRWQLLVEATNRAQMQAFLKPWLAQVEALNAKTMRWHIDVDPLEL